jgi:hypothetical protein
MPAWGIAQRILDSLCDAGLNVDQRVQCLGYQTALITSAAPIAPLMTEEDWSDSESSSRFPSTLQFSFEPIFRHLNISMVEFDADELPPTS